MKGFKLLLFNIKVLTTVLVYKKEIKEKAECKQRVNVKIFRSAIFEIFESETFCVEWRNWNSQSEKIKINNFRKLLSKSFQIPHFLLNF